MVATHGDRDPARRRPDRSPPSRPSLSSSAGETNPHRTRSPPRWASRRHIRRRFRRADKPNGQPYDNAPGGSETWVIESACRAGECVATATKVSGSQSTTSTLVLDEIDGRWMAVSATQGTCQNAARPNSGRRCPCSRSPTERWTANSSFGRRAQLRPQPTGDVHPHRRCCAQRVGRRPRSTAGRGWRRQPKRCTAGTRRQTPMRTAVAASK